MKKTIISIAAGVAALFVMTGCTSVNTNDGTEPVKIAINKEMTPEYTLGKKVSGEASVNNLFGFISWGVSEFADEAFVSTSNIPVLLADGKTVAKQGATFKACEAAKADRILGAKYRIDTKDYFVFKQIKCTVTGFPATLKSIK